MDRLASTHKDREENFLLFFLGLPDRIARVKVLYFNLGAATYVIEG
jgi:hypothetical protein